MLVHLSCAMASAVQMVSGRADQEYPNVDHSLLRFQEAISNGDLTRVLFPRPLDFFTDETLLVATEVLDSNKLVFERIIRRLSRRAGIPRLDNGAFQCIWGAIIRLIVMFVRPVCEELVYSAGLSSAVLNVKRVLVGLQTSRDVPPVSTTSVCSCCAGGLDYFHTIVPGRIEAAALSVVGSRRPYKVYGGGWLVPGTFGSLARKEAAVNRAIAEAENQYELEEESDVDEEMDSDVLSLLRVALDDSDDDGWSTDYVSEMSEDEDLDPFVYPETDFESESEEEDTMHEDD